MATHSSILAWRIPLTEELRSKEWDTTEATEHELGFSADLSSVIVTFYKPLQKLCRTSQVSAGMLEYVGYELDLICMHNSTVNFSSL